MNDFTLMRAKNDGWVLSEGVNDGLLRPVYAFSSTEDLLRALPEMLERKTEAPKPNQFQTEFQPGGVISRKFSADTPVGKN